jgi:ABC-type phosphate transport system substrate-binding protein
MDSLHRFLSRSSRSGIGVRTSTRTVTILCAVVLLSVTVSQAASIAVVVHPSVDVDDLTFAEFRKIILGDRQFWTGGKRITLIVRAPVADERTVLLERVYKMSEAQYRQYWVAKVFRAEIASGPRVVLSNEEAVDLVGVIDGAIAIVSSEDVPEGLKVLKIDGLLPGEPGYPLDWQAVLHQN